MRETSASSRFGVEETRKPSSTAGVEWARAGSSGVNPLSDEPTGGAVRRLARIDAPEGTGPHYAASPGRLEGGSGIAENFDGGYEDEVGGAVPSPMSSAGEEDAAPEDVDAAVASGSRRFRNAEGTAVEGVEASVDDGASQGVGDTARRAGAGAETNDEYRQRVAEDSAEFQYMLEQEEIRTKSGLLSKITPKGAAKSAASAVAAVGAAGIQQAPGTDIGDDSPTEAYGIEESARKIVRDRLAKSGASKTAEAAVSQSGGGEAAASRLSQARSAKKAKEASSGMARLRAKVRAMRMASRAAQGVEAAQRAGVGSRILQALAPTKALMWPLMVLGVGVLLIFLAFFGLSSCAGILGGIDASEEDDIGSLTGNEADIAQFLLDKGYDDIHVAAIMGNMRAEAGGTPGNDFNTGAVEIGSGAGHGICQWTGSRWDGAGGLLDFAESQGKDWTDLQVQLDYLWTELQANWIGGYTVSSASDDPPYPTSVYGSRLRFERATELEDAVEAFCYGFERPGIPHISRRIEYAEQYLEMMRSDGPSTEAQKRIVEAAKSTPSPGQGLCATWVSHVYVNAGFPYLSYQAPEWLASWCTSTDRSELKAGMVVAVRHSPYGGDGWDYGHVGIYIGDGVVMHNEGPIVSTPIDQWISTYAFQCEAHWGWPFGDLSED